MSIMLSINTTLCIKCGKCVKVCPSHIFLQAEKNSAVETTNVETCIVCGHCVAACPSVAVEHSAFPADTVHKIDYAQLPTPEQVLLLCKARRSNRAFSTKPVPESSMAMILEAAHRAPTGSNAQHVKFVVVSTPEKLRAVSDFTIDAFSGMVKKLKNPLLKPLIKLKMPEALRYLPVFERIIEDYRNGGDKILRGATTLLFMYTPKRSRMGAADANLAYQNGSLMAESLGVSQFYTGFVTNATKTKKGELEKILGIDGEIHAGMALGMPVFRYPNYIDRKPIEVKKFL